jgi:hypothetical protein
MTVHIKPLSMGSWVLGAVALAGAQFAWAAEGAGACEADGKTQFICGLSSPEDLITMPQTAWVIASGMSDPATHRSEIYAIDSKTRSYKVLYPAAGAKVSHDKKTYASCPGPLPGETFGAHGIDLRQKGKGQFTLYAVNHAGRESIEVFDVDATGTLPALTWIGCAVLPAKASGNGVVGLPDGGFITTNFRDPADADAFKHMTEGKITGEVLEWHPSSGWSTLPDSAMSGANGLALTADGKSLYVAGWPGRNVTRWERTGGSWAKKELISTGILTDNLRWMSDGSLLAGGQDSSMPAVFECRPPACRVGSAAIKIDLKTGKATRLVQYAGSEGFEGGTTALEVGNEIWFGSYKGNRIARLVAPK